jgi:hypothetical protein
MKQQAAKMCAQWMVSKGQNDRTYMQKKPEEKNFHAMVQNMGNNSVKQQKKIRQEAFVSLVKWQGNLSRKNKKTVMTTLFTVLKLMMICSHSTKRS